MKWFCKHHGLGISPACHKLAFTRANGVYTVYIYIYNKLYPFRAVLFWWVECFWMSQTDDLYRDNIGFRFKNSMNEVYLNMLFPFSGEFELQPWKNFLIIKNECRILFSIHIEPQKLSVFSKLLHVYTYSFIDRSMYVALCIHIHIYI